VPCGRETFFERVALEVDAHEDDTSVAIAGFWVAGWSTSNTETPASSGNR
jgi:hypothetical protein